MKGRVLVAGFATRHVAQSAFRAGYEVCAVDHFCDQDLNWYTRDRIKFDELEELPDAIHEMGGRYPFDFLVFTSGAEDLPATLPLCGTPRNRISRFLDKLETQEFLEGLGVPVPRIREPGMFPVIVKPRRGAGGWRNSVVTDPTGLLAWESTNPEIPYIRQEIVEGIPASVCCITNGTRARAITTNEQILRGKDDFGFCGSITPFIHPQTPAMIALAEKIAAASGCIGTIGVDFVCSNKGCYVIEVNPRFQATVDTVEAALGCNMFDLHVGACAGNFPSSIPTPHQVAVRSILFADRDITIRDDLKHLAPAIADIPWPGTKFEKDQAVVSVYGWGPDRDAALRMLDKHISTVRQYMGWMDRDDVLNEPAIRAYLHRLVGDDGLNLLERFPEEGEHSDEDLAAKTSINLNSVRHTLYTLYEKRLAEYHRIKNNETGWLTYLWQLRIDHIYDAIREDMAMVMEKLERRRKFEEENDFYICKECHSIFTFSQAMNMDFNCPACEQPMGHFDNEMLLKSLKCRIDAIKQTLGHV